MTFSLAELMVVAASRVFDDEGEVLATGIGLWLGYSFLFRY